MKKKSIFLIFLMLSSKIYAQCPYIDDISKFKNDPNGLSQWISDNSFDSICCFPIGEMYYEYFINKKISKQGYLDDAKRYLEYAARNMGTTGGYSRYYGLLIQIECYAKTPDVDKIISYTKRLPPSEPLDIQINRAHITDVINKRLISYNTDFLSNEYLAEYQTLIQALKINNEHSRRLLKTSELKQNYQKQYKTFLKNPNESAVKNILYLLNQMKYMDNIEPYLEAYRDMQHYYSRTNDNYEDAESQCENYKQAIKQLKHARNILGHIPDSKNAECGQKLACLSANCKSEIEKLFPTMNQPVEQFKKHECKMRLDAYQSLRQECPKVKVMDDQQAVLIELMQVYYAIDDYQKRNDISEFESVYRQTKNPKLQMYTGNYLATHYYETVSNQLKKGPMNEDALTVLKNIGSKMDSYNRYASYMQSSGKYNVFQQYRLLTRFFENISLDYDAALNDSENIDDALKQSWNIQAIIEKYKQQPKHSKKQLLDSTTISDNQTLGHYFDDKALLARKSFDSFEYFDAWEHYKQVYPQLVPNRLKDLVEQDESIHITKYVWNIVNAEDRIPLKILSLIIKMVTKVNDPSIFFDLVSKRNTGYPPEYSFHFAEGNHTLHEKSSDRFFFSGLCYYQQHHSVLNKHLSFEMLGSFLSAYNALGQVFGSFDHKTNQRINMKQNRCAYWLKKVWNKSDDFWRIAARNRYEQPFGPIFRILLLDKHSQHQQATNQTTIPSNVTVQTIKSTSSSDEQRLNQFEEYARMCEKFERPDFYTCSQLKSEFDSRIRGHSTGKCINSFIDLNRDLRKKSTEFYSRFYFAWAKIRKSQQRIDDWVENLALAYSSAFSDHQRKKIIAELAEARNECNQTGYKLNSGTLEKLQNYNLISRWHMNESQSTKEFSISKRAANEFSNPEQASRIANRLQQYSEKECHLHKIEILFFINMLFDKYRSTRDNSYLSIYYRLLPGCDCLSQEERVNFDERFQSISDEKY